MSSNLNNNKIAAAILSAGLIAMFSGKISEFLYYGGPQHPGAHHEEKRGYKIEVTEVVEGGAAAAPATAADISGLYAAADVKAGAEYVAKKCTVCHSIDKGGANKVGPQLWGLMNRPVASVAGFNYSSALKAHGGKWDFDQLNGFLWGPGKYVKGTIMSYAGIAKDQERANVIAYIAGEMTDSPAKLPTASAAPAAAPAAEPAKH